MSWIRLDPEEFWRLDEVQMLDIEAVGLMWWMVCRTWTNGGLLDDPEMYKKILRGRCPRFDALWKQVRPMWHLVDGELRFPWLESRRAEGVEFLKSEAERKRLARLGKAERPPDSAGQDRTSAGVRRNPRTNERTDGTNERDEQTNAVPSPSAPAASTPEAPVAKPKARSGPHADVIRHWESEWTRTRLGTSYAVEAKDGVAVAGVLKLANGDPLEVKLRATRLLEHPDKWLAENASLPLLRSRWNQLGVTVTQTQPLTGSEALKALRNMNGSNHR